MPLMHRFINNNLTWYLWVLFFIGITFFFPTLTFAADPCPGGVCVDTSSGALFTPSSSDQSIIYLGELFGSVPPVLAGTGSSIMSQLFKVLNTAGLTLGIIIAGYTTFVGILNTAGEGEMLGKNWNSIWVPVRTVAGIALLIPTGSGYCICQIFMMWLLVQGIGVADSLTSTVINYMYSGQKIFVAGETQQTDGDQIYSQYDTIADGTSGSMIASIFQGLSCMQAYQKEYPEVNPSYMSPPVAQLDNDTNPTTITYHFVANAGVTSIDPVTGIKTQTPVEKTCGYIVVKGITKSTYQLIEQGYSAIMPSLNAAAYYMVNSTAGSTTNPDGSVTDPIEDDVMQDTFNFVGADFLSEVEKTYHSYVIQAENQNASDNSGSNKDYEDIRAYGWASLGGMYWDMAESYGTTGSVKYNNGWDTNQTPYIGTASNPNNNYYPSTVWKYASGAAAPDGWATQFINDLRTTRENNGNNTNQLQKDFHSGQFNTTGAVASIAMNSLQDMTKNFDKHKNPMVIAQELGHDITYEIEIVFTAFQTAMGAVGIGVMGLGAYGWATSWMGAPGAIALILAIVSALSLLLVTFLPGLLSFMAVMLTLGGTLAVIIPFVPALAYFLAVIAWLIAALETIVAAPIVAIGVLHPDGQHPVWGKAEPAVMLIVNMFLRPSLLVLGFVAGIILSSISLQFINLSFTTAMHQILGNNNSTGAGNAFKTISGVEIMLFLGTYVGVVLACVNKSFSVIEAIPNTIMRWIGHDSRFESGSDAMQKIQGTQEGAAQKSADTSAQSTEGASHLPEKGAQAGGSFDDADAKADAADQREQKAKEDADAGTATGRQERRYNVKNKPKNNSAGATNNNTLSPPNNLPPPP